MENVYIVAANRTPVGKAIKGAFRHIRPDDLLAHAIKGTLEKVPTLDPNLLEDAIIGCAMPEAEQGMNVARIGVLLAGLPESVPAMTVNRYCSSGVETMAIAAQRIASGAADAIIAGGTESMSLIPMGGNKIVANPEFFTNNEEHKAIAYGMGLTAEKVVEKYNVTREAQDAFALESHRRACAANKAGYFSDEILPFDVTSHQPHLESGEITKKTKTLTQDEGPRGDSTIEALARLKPVFAKGGTVTAGNSSQMSDGAGAAVLVSERFLKEHNLTPLARFCGYSVAGVAPEIMGIGPVAAIPKVLKQTGLSLQDMDWIELNEAFAAQSLAVINELGLNQEIVNPLGGAIALGHPLGATGAIRMATTVHGLRRIKKKYGMITMCIGTGMGAAAIVEAL